MKAKNAAVGALTGSITGMIDFVLKSGPAFVKLFSPGTMVLFTDAMDNLGASIGSALVPLFEMARDTINALNAQLTNIAPIISRVMASFAPVFAKVNEIIGAMQPIFETWASYIEMIASYVEPVMMSLGNVIMKLIPMVGELFQALTELAGELLGVFDGAGDALQGFLDGFLSVVGKIKGLTYVGGHGRRVINLLEVGQGLRPR